MSNKDLSLKAIYSRSSKSASALLETAGNVSIYSDDSGSGNTYHDLLLRDDVQAVVVALPILTQPEFIEAALLAGKHVLSEKPIAKDLKTAENLLKFYETKVKGNPELKGVTWAVAENFRFIESIHFAAKEVKKLGKVLGFRASMGTNVLPGGIFYGNVLFCATRVNVLLIPPETPWRKVPEYQGGFLLDGGVHNVAAIRLLLGNEAKPAALSAFTTLLKKHLPPVDTVDSIWALETKASGTFSLSFGTTFTSNEYSVACEQGTVKLSKGPPPKFAGKVLVTVDGKETETSFEADGTGVEPEIVAWTKSIISGKPDSDQAPEQALADLEILQKMLESGESHGKTEALKYQV